MHSLRSHISLRLISRMSRLGLAILGLGVFDEVALLKTIGFAMCGFAVALEGVRRFLDRRRPPSRGENQVAP